MNVVTIVKPKKSLLRDILHFLVKVLPVVLPTLGYLFACKRPLHIVKAGFVCENCFLTEVP